MTKLNYARQLSGRTRIVLIVSIICLLSIFVGVSSAQKQADSPATSQPTQPSSQAPASTATGITAVAANDERYRIGPGDVLDIRVFNRPQLSREARVDSNGMIQMPLIEGDIRAACRTESELAKDIATLYLKYQRNPFVNVFVKDYSSTPVAVIGAVEKPGRFQLTRRVRLLELLAFAGGQTEKAGGKVQIAHTGQVNLCDSPDAASERTFEFYVLKDVLSGATSSNPFIRPGDIISIPEADQAFVIGNVFKPSAISLKDPVTVSEAIAAAGGALRASKLGSIKIRRRNAQGVGSAEIVVDLVAINKRKADDILLQPNDVVEVPTSEGKLAMDRVFGALTNTLTAIPYVVR